jgi:hypothetical protein
MWRRATKTLSAGSLWPGYFRVTDIPSHVISIGELLKDLKCDGPYATCKASHTEEKGKRERDVPVGLVLRVCRLRRAVSVGHADARGVHSR